MGLSSKLWVDLYRLEGERGVAGREAVECGGFERFVGHVASSVRKKT